MRNLALFLLLSLLVAPALATKRWESVGIGSHDVSWPGGSGTLSVGGTFGGATVTFFYCPPHTNLSVCLEIDSTDCTFTAAGFCDFFKGPGNLRLTVTGGTPAIDAVAAGPTQASIRAPIRIIGNDLEIQGNLSLPGASVATETTLEFGTSGAGMNEVTGEMNFVVGEVNTFKFSGGIFASANGNGPALINEAGSPTNPTTLFNRADLNSGGGGVANEPSIIAESVEIATFTTAGMAVADGLRFEMPESSTPPTSTDSALYYDSDVNLPCYYNGTNWVQFSDNSTVCS